MNLSQHDGKQTRSGAKALVDARAVYEQLGRILSDPLFHNSKRFSTLLKFIVDETLEEKHDSLKERVIGIEVFGRAADYDTSQDASVRVAVAEVRRRLGLYYRESGHENELRIELPVRSYVAEFKEAEASRQEDESKLWPRLRSISIGLFAVAVILAVGNWGAKRLFAPPPVIDRFWAPILATSVPVSISIGIEAEDKSSTLLPSGDSVTPLYAYLANQPKFPLTDLSAAGAITSYLGRRGKQCDIEIAQETKLADLRRGPLVLLGSIRNDWTVRLGTGLRFQFKQESPHRLGWIEDLKNPSSKQWSIDFSTPYEQINHDFALVTRLFDQTTGQWWVGIAGLTGFGTLAGQQMITDPKAMDALASQLPENWDRKNLQFVLEVAIVNGSIGAARTVAVNSW